MSMLTVRTDETIDQALAYLRDVSGQSQSTVIRQAVLQAERQARRDAMRREALEVVNDPEDRKEAKAILDYMGGSDAW